ncbi:MAG: NADH-quinone oxidoreductase subunit NuoG [Ilumatobacteraceae bacterium]|nr:NADH-quinone oxidoreductase subunit NuoG [Ilumatobacteraceae bacterium]
MTDIAAPKTTVSVTVDGRTVEAKPGELLINACEHAGSFVPHFCYHPRMSSVGMCRQCIVEVDGPRGKALVVSCMTPVAEGQVVSTTSEPAKRAQEGVLELLLANHPLDCPVCDKGGECPLQDQAFSHGPGESRYVEEKRHYEKPIPISDLVFLDRERCILCDRCTRFASEVAGDPLITFTSRGNDTQIMTFPDEPFSSYFSGNTVQICPVGALTASPYRFKARPWDLEQVESTCTTCSVGCRTVVQSSRDELVRYQGVDIESVNWGWLCDRGRFNFESVNSKNRVNAPLVRKDGALVDATWSSALDAAGRILRTIINDKGPSAVAIIGGARGSNEDAFAWATLADLLGINARDAQLADGLPAEVFALPQATIAETCVSSTVILLAPDLKEELPVLYLRLRDAAEKRKTRIIEVSPRATGLTDYAWKSIRHDPGDQPRVVRELIAMPEVAAQLALGNVTVVVGRGNLAESPEFALLATGAVLHAVPEARVLPVVRRGNVRGAIAAGLTPRQADGDTNSILAAAAAGKVECLILLGADPVVDVPDADLVRRAFASVKHIIAVDTFVTESARHAEVLLPAAAYGEKVGTTTNCEGRVSDVAQKITTAGTARPDWMIAAELALELGVDLGYSSYTELHDAMTTTVAAFAPAAVAKAVRHEGVVVAHPAPVRITAAASSAAPRLTHHFRLLVSRVLYDRAVSTSESPSLAPLARDSGVHLHSSDAQRLAVREGSDVRVAANGSAIVLPVVIDDAVSRGVAFVPFNQHGSDIRQLIRHDVAVTDAVIEVV